MLILYWGFRFNIGIWGGYEYLVFSRGSVSFVVKKEVFRLGCRVKFSFCINCLCLGSFSILRILKFEFCLRVSGVDFVFSC